MLDDACAGYFDQNAGVQRARVDNAGFSKCGKCNGMMDLKSGINSTTTTTTIITTITATTTTKQQQ